MSLLKVALEYLAANITTIPIALDGSKAPATDSWRRFIKEPPTEKQLRAMFAQASGIAVLGGPTSGGLEIIDFDKADAYAPWCDLVEHIAPGLLARLPVVKTPNGYHVYIRSESPEGNQKLAKTLVPCGDTHTEGKCTSCRGTGMKEKTAIETRGTGGYVIAPPSPAKVHPSGVLYALQGSVALTDTPMLTAEERGILISSARSFNEVVKESKSDRAAASSTPSGKGRAGDDFNARVSWREILMPHGWTIIRELGNVIHWQRPGKDGKGISATTGFCGDKLWVFSSNAQPFDAERAYAKFSAYGHLNHGGDFKAAARALKDQGFGDQRIPQQPRLDTSKWGELNDRLDNAFAPQQDVAKGWHLDSIPDAPLPSDEDAPPDLAPSAAKIEHITAQRLEGLMEDDPAAFMQPDVFPRIMALKTTDKAEWVRVGDLLRRLKKKEAFNRAVKDFEREQQRRPTSDGWRSGLTYKTNKDGEQTLERTVANLSLILREDPAWRGVLALNTLSNRIVTRTAPPFERDIAKPWSDTDSLATRAWIEVNYCAGIKTNDVHEAVILAASMQKFNPLVDYVNGLESPDGESSLDTWLVDIFGVENTEYTRAVGRRWMISAIARALHPGVKADCVLILEGDQGMKKSSVLAQLCPNESWFIDGLSDFGSKDQKEEIEGKWIVELGELKGFGKELEQIKAFTSRTTEKYRPSYGRFTVETPRTCIFAGTVNPDNVGYLRDVTGNRRFWPVRCRKAAPTITPAMRDKLWAEARDAYLAGLGQAERDERTKWWIDPHERELHAAAIEQQEARVEVDVWHDAVAEYITGKDDVSINEILKHIGVKLEQAKASEGQRVGRILKMLRWEKYRSTLGTRPWRYRPPAAQLQLVA